MNISIVREHHHDIALYDQTRGSDALVGEGHCVHSTAHAERDEHACKGFPYQWQVRPHPDQDQEFQGKEEENRGKDCHSFTLLHVFFLPSGCVYLTMFLSNTRNWQGRASHGL